MEINDLYSIFLAAGRVTTDSRNTPQGSLFIALKGENFNGNRYAAQALEGGCSYAIVDEAEYADGEHILLVDDCLHTLQQLAHHHRMDLATPVIAITGTNGKTTTKELLAATLSQKFKVLYTQGNLNNHIGVPLTLLQLRPDHEVAVVEMGANHPHEIATLAQIAQPNYGLITNVGKAHLEGFGSFEGVLRTKCELYDALRATGGHLFRLYENDYLETPSQGIEQTLYGEAEGLFVSGTAEVGKPQLSFHFSHNGVEWGVNTQLVGNYNLPNALAATTVALYLGVDGAAIKEALETYIPQNNRSQLAQTPHNSLIIDAYNANPTSMMAALQNFGQMTVTPKGVILGDMRELGVDSLSEHQQVVEWLTTAPLDRVILVGEEFGKTGSKFETYPSVAQLVDELKQHPITGFHLLIKGSRGIKLEQTLTEL